MSFLCVLHILRHCADLVLLSDCADLIASNKRRKKTISRNKPIYYGVIRLNEYRQNKRVLCASSYIIRC